MKSFMQNLQSIGTPEQLRQFGQALIDAANMKDEKQKALDNAFAQVTNGLNALKNL